MSQEEQASRQTRLVVDLAPELRRRVKAAAGDRDISVREYVVAILEDAVPELPGERSGRRLAVNKGTARRLGRTREKIMRGRRFEDDSAELIEQAREERAAEL